MTGEYCERCGAEMWECQEEDEGEDEERVLLCPVCSEITCGNCWEGAFILVDEEEPKMRCENCEHTIPLMFAPDKRNPQMIHAVILDADADAISEEFFHDWEALPWAEIGPGNIDARFLATQFGVTEELAEKLFEQWADWVDYYHLEEMMRSAHTMQKSVKGK